MARETATARGAETANLPWKTAWVVGASSGIGRAVALHLARGGVRVAVSARRAEALDAIAAEMPGKIAVLSLDVTDSDAVSDAAAVVEAAIGPPDLVVAAAGVWTPFRLDDLSVAPFREAVEVNYLGTVATIAAVLPAMRRRGTGQIGVLASVAGYSGLPKAATYAPTKAALINLAECLRTELDGSGVVVSLVNPGFVETALTAKNDFPMPFIMTPEAAAKRIVAGLAARRFETAFPRRLALILKLLRILPYPVYFWIIRKMVSRR